MFIYNLSLIILFWCLFNVIVTQLKTLHTFNGLSFNSYYLLLVTTLLFSMAGVPPFLGFFSKLFILTLLASTEFFILYALFFVFLFLGLYFYIQNIRFLHSTNHSTLNYPSVGGNEKHTLLFYYGSITFLTILIAGPIIVDDVLFLFT